MFARVCHGFTIRAVASMSAAAFIACAGEADHASQRRIVIPGANVERGKQLVTSHNCVACHTISDIRDANATVGPPLTGFANRALIAGQLANEPANLVRWIMNPSAVEPHTVMPDMGLTQNEARDVAAYLYTLK